jgi:seryl-tRNA synthetase
MSDLIERLREYSAGTVLQREAANALEQAQNISGKEYELREKMVDEMSRLNERIEQLEAALRTLCTCAELGPMTICLACKVLESVPVTGNDDENIDAR